MSIIWKGELSTAPSSPEENWAYYNSTEGVSYIYDGSQWNVLAQDGSDGTDGLDGMDGSNGVSIIWLGEYVSAPSGANLNNAYYNTSNGNSYIYNGSDWDLLAGSGADGADGMSIIWKGELSTAPSSPEENWAYYNSTEGVSYIYDGSQWNVLLSWGRTSSELSVVWKGSLSIVPENPEVNWAYFNTIDQKNYLYNGISWEQKNWVNTISVESSNFLSSSFAINENGDLWGQGFYYFDYNTFHSFTNFGVISENVVKIDYQDSVLMVLKEDKSLYGYNYQQNFTDDPYFNYSHNPKKLMTFVDDFVFNNGSLFVIKEDKSLWVCGENGYGQLGDGSIIDIAYPKQIMSEVEKVVTGHYCTFVIKKDRSLWAFGNGNN